MLTPEGKFADDIDPIMLLALWTKLLVMEMEAGKNIDERPYIISAGMGKPTYPINDFAVVTAIAYWSNLLSKAKDARHLWASMSDKNRLLIEKAVRRIGAVVDYGDPKGDKKNREKVASALSGWYGIDIEADNILFTVGGAGAIYIIKKVIDARNPAGKIVTPVPYYTLYGAEGWKHKIHPVSVMEEPGYRLTAHALAKSIEGLSSEEIGAFLFCDPNNPLGLCAEVEELVKIAEVLRSRPGVPIILDEAYAEMCLDRDHMSLLKIAPDLKDRIILMRSATKGLSAAGERMAVAVAFDKEIMTGLLAANISICGHAPRSLQEAFAVALGKLDKEELSNITKFYKPKLDYVFERVKNMGAALPDKDYKPNGPFYVMADFSDLIGLEIPLEANRALGREVIKDPITGMASIGQIQTDEDICYYLLFKDGAMIAPVSYYGLDKNLGYMRITCSDDEEELNVLMDRLEKRLVYARKSIQRQLIEKFHEQFAAIMAIDTWSSAEREKINTNFQLFSHILKMSNSPLTACQLKENNEFLKEILRDMSALHAQHSPEKFNETVVNLQSIMRALVAKNEYKTEKAKEEKQWKEFVTAAIKDPQLQAQFFAVPPSKRQLQVSKNDEDAQNKNNLPRAKL